MKNWKERAISALCLTALLLPLFGCAKEEDEEDRGIGAMGSEVWETMPALTYGEMEYEKLQVLDWNSGRCEATSFNQMAETENGYYMAAQLSLYYTDKADISNWVPVCNNPDCMHNSKACSAVMLSDTILVQTDRIYTLVNCDRSILGAENGPGAFILSSMNADGTDRKFEFAFDEAVPTSATTESVALTAQHFFYNTIELNEDGSTTGHAYMASKNGWKEIATVENYSDSPTISQPQSLYIYGDRLIKNKILAESRDVYFRFNGDEPEEIDLTGLPIRLSYLSGDTLRFFRINDGYYDVNIKTGEEVKLSDAQLENSAASIVLPNCIVESTLMAYLSSASDENYVEGMAHEMKLFDGESWRNVTLPDELVNANGKTFIRVQAVTSESIILYSRDMSNYRSTHLTKYYKIDLTQEELTLENFYDHTY